MIPFSEFKNVFWMFNDDADRMFCGKFNTFRFGRPEKSILPTCEISWKLSVLSVCRLLRPNVPPIDCRLSAEMDETLVAPVAVRSPVMRRTPGKSKIPAASVAIATLPEKVVHDDRPLASAGETTVRVADVLQPF